MRKGGLTSRSEAKSVRHDDGIAEGSKMKLDGDMFVCGNEKEV